MMSFAQLDWSKATHLGAAFQFTRPMGYQSTAGPAVNSITRLGWGLGIISLVVVLIVSVLLLFGIFRGRPSADEWRNLTVRQDAGGMAWIYIGVGTSSLVLLICMVWTLLVTAEVTHPAGGPEFTVEITASQWWWSARYLGGTPDKIFSTANEIHIPVGRPIRFELVSGDVIHSFWVPKLAGKMDVIPGQTNVMWLQADESGTYRGQCTAFCGMQHAHMALSIVAQSPEDFAAWRLHELASAPVPATNEAQLGQHLFETHCAVCHTIRGIAPAGLVGPDLTHLMTRETIAAGLLQNTPGNLARWIANPQTVKPGTRMPRQVLSAAELTDITAFLTTLN